MQDSKTAYMNSDNFRTCIILLIFAQLLHYKLLLFIKQESGTELDVSEDDDPPPAPPPHHCALLLQVSKLQR